MRHWVSHWVGEHRLASSGVCDAKVAQLSEHQVGWVGSVDQWVQLNPAPWLGPPGPTQPAKPELGAKDRLLTEAKDVSDREVEMVVEEVVAEPSSRLVELEGLDVCTDRQVGPVSGRLAGGGGGDSPALSTTISAGRDPSPSSLRGLKLTLARDRRGRETAWPGARTASGAGSLDGSGVVVERSILDAARTSKHTVTTAIPALYPNGILPRCCNSHTSPSAPPKSER